ncbi:hypothetical protein GCM10009774_28140 [Cellulomonas gelida]|uniref:Uncharacterized protein n=1 Tax=Cellulomonas gelida TaxID=1712 RepID=A0A4Y3KG98_9CELL|nr:hypothetical protein CGE01nite_02780 [Cellulomonas gelida]GGL35923.1 hypothetical protein GCM10009774_28140 [Cellulomonas gelida]
MPVLRQQQHPVVVVERDHRDRARVRHVLTHHLRLTQVDAVAREVPDTAVVDDLVLEDLVPRRDVPDGLVGPDAARQLSSCRASAAATRPANSGWARFGRDLNSGCACVET